MIKRIALIFLLFSGRNFIVQTIGFVRTAYESEVPSCLCPSQGCNSELRLAGENIVTSEVLVVLYQVIACENSSRRSPLFYPANFTGSQRLVTILLFRFPKCQATKRYVKTDEELGCLGMKDIPINWN